MGNLNTVDGTIGDDLIDNNFIDEDGQVMDTSPITNDPALALQEVDAGDGNDTVLYYWNMNVRGGAGDDYIAPSAYDPLIDDSVFGDEVGGIINGNDGNDTLVVGQVGDYYGDAGDDTFVVSDYSGSNYTANQTPGYATFNPMNDARLTGGEGADTFIISGFNQAVGKSEIRITDFTIGEDTLIINGVEINGSITAAGATTQMGVNAYTDYSIDHFSYGEYYVADDYDYFEDDLDYRFYGDYDKIPQLITVDPINAASYGPGADMVIVLGSGAPDAYDFTSRTIILEGVTTEAFVSYYAGFTEGPANGVVNGSLSDDVIDLTYADSGNESVTDDAAISDVVEGSDGADTIHLYAGNDIADGGRGDDVIYGYSGNNEIHGGIGFDTLYSGIDTSTLDGGFDVDTLIADISNGADHQLTGGRGNDFFNIVGSSADGSANVTITDFDIYYYYGESYNPPASAYETDILMINGEVIDGYNMSPVINVTYVYSNTILHMQNGDTITLAGVSRGEFTDRDPLSLTPNGVVDGTEGNDLIDLAYIDAQQESVTNDPSISDVVNGNGGNDRIVLYAGDDVANGGEGNDEILGSKGHNILHGNNGNDTLYSGRDTSELFGDAGDDLLVARMQKGGDHVLTGGTGADTFEMFGAATNRTSNVVITDFVAGEDILTIDEVEIDTFNLPAGFAFSEDADGNAVLQFGDDETITFSGLAISDLSNFVPANGVVDGTEGNDALNLAFLDDAEEQITNDAAISDVVDGHGGDDTIYLYAGDDIATGGDGADHIYGMKGHNTLSGGAGNDLLHSGRNSSELFGDDGDDTLIAQLNKGGDHTLTGGQGADSFEMLAAANNKTAHTTITDFVVGEDALLIGDTVIDGFNLPADVTVTENADGDVVLHFNDDETVTLTGVNAFDFTGVVPTSAPNGIVDGTMGNDLMNLAYVDAAGEQINDNTQRAKHDNVNGHSGDDTIYLYAGNDVAHGGAGDDRIYGMKGRNKLYGDEGNDYLHSGRYSSALLGGAGDDILVAQLNKGGNHSLTGGGRG